jgi:chromate transporter
MSKKVQKLKEAAFLFLKLGIIGFGEPAAHIGLMHNEVIKKRKWLRSPQYWR